MKKAIVLLFLSVALACHAQTSGVKVTLKSGTVISGSLKELVVTDHITVNVSGVESVIPMAEVDKIENVEGKNNAGTTNVSNVLTSGQYGAYEITDQGNYPESFVLDLNGQKLTMVLVKGGVFNMGYDDRHSLSMNSEPVHQVSLSSFYVSKELVSKSVAQDLLGVEIEKKKNENFYDFDEWEEANTLVTAVADYAQKPYRMITEAEWEYLSLMPFAPQVFGEQKSQEWCLDYYDEYDAKSQVNPQGPPTGKRHVTRSYNGRRNKWDRKNVYSDRKTYVRVAIDANKIE